MAKKDAVDIIDAKIEKIASIEEKRKLQDINLKDKVLSATESNIDNIKGDNKQLESTIRENSGLLNFMRRFLKEVRELLPRPVKQTKTQNNLALSSNNIKSINNQLVEISMLNHDKNLESAEKFDGGVLDKVGYQKHDIIAFENKDSSGIMRE